MPKFIEVTLYDGTVEAIQKRQIRRVKQAKDSEQRHHSNLFNSDGTIWSKVELVSSKAHDVVELFVQETYEELMEMLND